MKLALVYDRINKIGGAEKVIQAFHELYPDAPIFTSVYNPTSAPFAKRWNIIPTFLNKLPFIRTRHELFPFLMPFAFESLDFSDYDTVISISSSESKGIITPPSTLHINYCLTPTRYLWSHAGEYQDSTQFGIVQKISRPIIKQIINRLRSWDLVASVRPDIMISISEHVKKRVKKYYKRNSNVVYPPVEINKFTSKPLSKVKERDYYLMVSRLVPYKKIDLAIDAFNQIGKPLVIVGAGSERARLQKKSKANITFTGLVSEKKLIAYYSNCKAYLQVNEEDFGISMVEAQAAGKPVLAYNKGGAREIVTQKTGALFDVQSINAIMHSVDEFEGVRYAKNDCITNSKRFDKNKFKSIMQRRIKEEWQKLNQT